MIFITYIHILVHILSTAIYRSHNKASIFNAEIANINIILSEIRNILTEKYTPSGIMIFEIIKVLTYICEALAVLFIFIVIAWYCLYFWYRYQLKMVPTWGPILPLLGVALQWKNPTSKWLLIYTN